ncbi:hypothetical protein, partial [Pseudomonas sp. FEN]
ATIKFPKPASTWWIFASPAFPGRHIILSSNRLRPISKSSIVSWG